MKKGKQQLITVLIACILVLIASTVKGQVQIDKPLQLTGTGLDARVMGIDTVADAKDAISLEYLQSGVYNYAVSTGTGNNYIIALPYFSGAPVEGMVIKFKADRSNLGNSVSLTINGVTNSITVLIGTDIFIINQNIHSVVFNGVSWQLYN